jgi:hypothetical protein
MTDELKQTLAPPSRERLPPIAGGAGLSHPESPESATAINQAQLP